MYWIYRTRFFEKNGNTIQAQLVDPAPKNLIKTYGAYGFQDPMQQHPYGTNLKLTFQVDPLDPQYDNYYQGAGFTLYSERLVAVMNSFGVKGEAFPASFVDKDYKLLNNLRSYFVFHSLEGIQPAMDEKASGWAEDRDIGIKKLVLDFEKFEHRPVFVCNNVYVPLMRDDLKKEIEKQSISGFRFYSPEDFKTGKYGNVLHFNT